MFCSKYGFPIFDPALDSALIAKWLEQTNEGNDLHALMSSDFSQGFLMGRILTMMENELAFEDDEDGEAE